MEVEFRIGGDGECEQILLSEVEFERVFGAPALERYRKFHPTGDLTMDANGYLVESIEIPVAFSDLLEVIGASDYGDLIRVRIEVCPRE